MGRDCSACVHAERGGIDAALAGGTASNRRIAADFGLTEPAVRRHHAAHLPQSLVKAQAAEEVADADQLLTQVMARLAHAERIAQVAEGLIVRAASAGDIRTSATAVHTTIAAAREVRETLELLAKLILVAKQQVAGAAEQESYVERIHRLRQERGLVVLGERSADRVS